MKLQSEDDLVNKKAIRLIRTRHAMTLATASSGNPWAAPVYYVNINAGFYFFSSHQSRHIQDALASGQAACAIYEEETSWEAIQGLQMIGAVYPVRPGTEAASAVLAYVKKFPFVRSFFKDTRRPDLAGFQRLFQANLYCFMPEQIYYMDNALRFGLRKKIPAGDLFQ